MTSKPHSDWIPYRYADARPPPLQLGGVGRPGALGTSGAPHPDPERRAPVLIPSHTAGAGWRRRAFLPQLWAPGGLSRPALPHHSSAGVAGRDQFSGPVWAVLGRAAPCGRAGRERTALSPLLGPAHRVTRRYSCRQTLVQLQARTPRGCIGPERLLPVCSHTQSMNSWRQLF